VKFSKSINKWYFILNCQGSGTYLSIEYRSIKLNQSGSIAVIKY